MTEPGVKPDCGAKTSAADSTDLGQALDMLWMRYRDEILKRVDLLDAAANASMKSRLTAREREDAKQAAHKLAGSLGTFNLAHGTDLAREFELLISGEEPPADALAGRLSTIAAELRSIIQNRK